LEHTTSGVAARAEENAAAAEQLGAQTRCLSGVADRLRDMVG
jgi:hypothetical protein